VLNQCLKYTGSPLVAIIIAEFKPQEVAPSWLSRSRNAVPVLTLALNIFIYVQVLETTENGVVLEMVIRIKQDSPYQWHCFVYLVLSFDIQ
jgi:hypothetical protein